MVFKFLLSLAIFFQIDAISFAKLFDRTMAGIQWTLLMSPAIVTIKKRIQNYQELDKCPDASQELATMFKEYLKKYNCSESLIEKIKFKLGDDCQAESSLFYKNKDVISINRQLQNSSEWTLNQRRNIIALIRHEAAHLENYDALRVVVVYLLVPILVNEIINKTVFSLKFLSNSSKFLKAILKVPLAYLNLMIADKIFIVFSKYKEYCADRVAAKNITDYDVLQSFANLMLEIYEDYEKSNNLHPSQRDTWKRFIYDELNTPDIGHPNYYLRHKIFKKYAEKLNKSV